MSCFESNKLSKSRCNTRAFPERTIPNAVLVSMIVMTFSFLRCKVSLYPTILNKSTSTPSTFSLVKSFNIESILPKYSVKLKEERKGSKQGLIYNHTIDCNQHYTVNGVSLLIARSLICNCPLLKDTSFNTKRLLVWCDF